MEEQNIQLQEEAKGYVESTGKWYKFFYILGIIGIVFMILCGIMMIAMAPMMNSLSEMSEMEEINAQAGVALSSGLYIFMGIIYLALAGLYIPIVIYLKRAADAASTACALNSNEAAVRFLQNSKSFWKFYGILTIVVLALCIIAIPIGMVAGVAAAL